VTRIGGFLFVGSETAKSGASESVARRTSELGMELSPKARSVDGWSDRKRHRAGGERRQLKKSYAFNNSSAQAGKNDLAQGA